MPMVPELSVPENLISVYTYNLWIILIFHVFIYFRHHDVNDRISCIKHSATVPFTIMSTSSTIVLGSPSLFPPNLSSQHSSALVTSLMKTDSQFLLSLGFYYLLSKFLSWSTYERDHSMSIPLYLTNFTHHGIFHFHLGGQVVLGIKVLELFSDSQIHSFDGNWILHSDDQIILKLC